MQEQWLENLDGTERWRQKIGQGQLRIILGKIRLCLPNIFNDIDDILLPLVLVSLDFWTLLLSHYSFNFVIFFIFLSQVLRHRQGMQRHMVCSLHIRFQIVVFGQSLQGQQLKSLAIEMYVTDLLVFSLFLLEFRNRSCDSLLAGHLIGLAEEI